MLAPEKKGGHTWGPLTLAPSSSPTPSTAAGTPLPLLQLVLSAEAVVVSLDRNYRPKRLSAALRKAMLRGQPLSEADRQRIQELL